ncbi:MAG: hypothetical protein ACR2OJ_17010 [Hyphomicrobiales bacterium]
MRSRVQHIFAIMLMVGLVLPICSKAFAGNTSSADNVAIAAVESELSAALTEGKNETVPCLSCCGGWTALPHAVISQPRPNDKVFTFLNAHSYLALQPTYGLSLIKQRAPPELGVPDNRSAAIFVRTSRLLL